MSKVICVCGARPNFMKIAPIVKVLGRTDGVESRLVHTGQHYDERMSDLFFEQLHIPKPDINLDVGSLSHAAQTAEVMKRFEPVCLEERPDWVVVVGDVNSTLACALVAVKLGIRIAHVEAGLRSFDRAMPEEINRVLTDTISDQLFVTEPSGLDNLRREGVDDDRVHHVGNVMIDTLLACRERAAQSDIHQQLGLSAGSYALATLHRPSNVDDRATFAGILDALEAIGQDMPVMFPIHPRSRNNLESLGLRERVESMTNLRLIDPLGYLDFLKLMSDAAVVLTDSGGVQEETTIVNVPCLTLRENTERPVTITQGTNQLTGSDPKAILNAYQDIRQLPPSAASPPHLWDGHAAERIVAILTGTTCRTTAEVSK